MSIFLKTQQRRILKKLCNTFDNILSPSLKNGAILAISGGADSRALLEAFAVWDQRFFGASHVVVVDHQVRASSQAEAEWVVGRAKTLGFSAEVVPLIGLAQGEAEFRKARYAALTQIANQKGLGSIVLAHNCDDDTEGFFMSLLGKGGGAMGAAMPAISLSDGIKLLRPFLSLSKKDLLHFLTLHGHTNFVRDDHDLDLKNERAKMRFEVLPKLGQNDKNFHTRIQKYAQKQRDANEHFLALSSQFVTIEPAFKATLDLSMIENPRILESAIKMTLKKLIPNKDMRASEPTVLRIVDEVLGVSRGMPGLDRDPKLFKVSPLEQKHYQFPGVTVRTSGNTLVFTLI